VKRRLLCECDCNDDGTVAINEVQGLSAVFLGTQSLDYCPFADANLDGAISIEELQRAINLYLGGCP
jgi:hypothetical protein